MKQETKWVSVNDRLPEIDPSTKYTFGSHSKEVLVFSFGNIYFSKYCFDHYGDPISWVRINASQVNITHWHPLPEPPNPTDND